MNKIKIEHYHYACGEPGCCDEYGIYVYVNDKKIGSYYDIDENTIEDILKEFGIESEVVRVNEDGEEM